MVINKYRPARNLSTTLAIAFIGLSVVVLLISQILQIIPTIQSQQAVVASQQQLIAQEASKIVSGSIQEKFTVLETTIEVGNPVSADAEAQRTILGALIGLQPAFSQLALLDSNGRQVSQISRLASALSPQFKERIKGDLLTQTSKGLRYISPVFIDELTSEPLVIIAVPAKSIFGDFQGILAAELNLKFMWDLVDQLKVGESGYAYVVDKQGNLIAFGDTARVLSGENVGHISKVKEFIESLPSSVNLAPRSISYTGLRGTSVVGSYVPLGTPDWAVVIELPQAEAYQTVIQGIIRTTINILAMVILAGLAGYFVARRLAKPLIDLSNVAKEVAGGNLALQAKVTGPAEISLVATTFNTMISELNATFKSLDERVRERTMELDAANRRNERRAAQFEAIAQVSRSISSTLDLNTLLPQITSVISRLFGFYHVGIFLLDVKGQYAVLSAANSEGGQRMLARNHKLRVGETGIVGYVTSTGNARVALDTGADAVYFNNPDLPYTRSEIALPFQVGEKVIGALDVQSKESNAFAEEDISILSILSEQVGIAIQNSRQYEETRRALTESEMLSQQFIRQGWQQFTKSRSLVGIRHTGAKATFLYAKNGEGKDENWQSLERPSSSGDAALVLPVKLRDEVIGTVNINNPGNREWDQDELDIVTAILERAAVSLENARLLAESQRRAAKERTIGEISSRISAQSDIDELLKTAAHELGRTMPNANISIQFKKDDANK
jgi:GAF domain-containing protein/HAMP domain-containing protein